jgi:AcrR family transcriptional regulator
MAARRKKPVSFAGAKKLFLETLRDTGSVARAARKSGLNRSTWYRHRRKSERFAAVWAEALDEGIEKLEEEALRRAITGTSQPVFFRGERIGDVRRYSDALLMFLLRAHRPQRYRDGADPVVPVDNSLHRLLEDIDGKTRGIVRGTETID